MNHIPRPTAGEYPPYYEKYIALVKGENIFDAYIREHMETMELLTSLDEETLRFRYAEGKWTIRGITQHLIDTERIVCYRALRISRSDPAALPGFDENAYVAQSNADQRNIDDMVRELSVVRASSVELFKSFDESILERRGTANGMEVSVRSIAYFMLGHEIHHRNVIEERYLPK